MRLSYLVVPAVLILLVALPPFLNLGLQFTLITALVAALFATAFNLLAGQAGMLSFGHAAFFGLGAFGTLHLMRAVEEGLGVPTVLLPAFGGLVGLITGLAFGYFATKRAGAYFSLITLALAELLHVIAPRWTGMFGGEAGISSMRMPSLGFSFGATIEVYYLTLAWVLLCLGALYYLTRTPFGLLTLAIRDSEQRVRFMGYDAERSKVLIFALSAGFAGVAGGLSAMSSETANFTIFGMQTSSQAVLYAFVGGTSIFLGPAVGAVVFTLFAYWVSSATTAWMFYQGLIFVLVILYAPNGIGGVLQSHYRARHRLDWKRLALPYAQFLLGAAIVTCGTVFIVHAVEILFAPSYKMAAASAATLPEFQMFGRSWAPVSVVTIGLPVLALGVGIALLRHAVAASRAVWAGPAATEILPEGEAA
ncbi:branched-chain amino acid ABC transporter permease [Xinfangfangia sp. D13-10-4-6]|uniref:branched-chain amino acid ABC transporter permease n=1 Tax=Pseudogemmobacter hezensis TaxID=2737662 RepID=UPI001552BF10|nr:branched-chain amino acid ABC transporter permease [Pseudogemmobacter hezensis]NPD17434.1 branched-chain amino acid ABC transporter permease [Pseudogemmobacter hezensis]